MAQTKEGAIKVAAKRIGISFKEYKKTLSEQIAISKLVNQQIRNKILVSDQEVDEYFNKVEEPIILQESYRLRQIFFKMPVKDINNVIKDKNLTNNELETFLDLFTRKDLRVLAKKYKIPQQSLKDDFVIELVWYRRLFNHHKITIGMI